MTSRDAALLEIRRRAVRMFDGMGYPLEKSVEMAYGDGLMSRGKLLSEMTDDEVVAEAEWLRAMDPPVVYTGYTASESEEVVRRASRPEPTVTYTPGLFARLWAWLNRPKPFLMKPRWWRRSAFA